MARNSEKAQSMLNRMLKGKQDEKNGPRKKRPYLATECHDLHEADQWRQTIVREIGKQVMVIQNGGMGEHKIRDLNDEINKLIREKGHWERRIKELGGPDYSRTAPRSADTKGREVAELTGACALKALACSIMNMLACSWIRNACSTMHENKAPCSMLT